VETQGEFAPLSPETVRVMGAAAGLDIDADRLPVVTDVLSEMLTLAARLEQLDLEGIEPDDGDVRNGWEQDR
jgi:hypothetical protein